MNWHLLRTEKALEETGSATSGLTRAEAAARLQSDGPNVLLTAKKRSAWRLFLSQFYDFMTLVLVTAAIIAGIAGDRADTLIILSIVVLNALLGFAQQYRAEKAMEALKRLGDPLCTVWREGLAETIPVANLVTGDIALLDAGNVVPADLRLLEVQSLAVMEAALTGESVPVQKTVRVPEEDTHSLGDRHNMAYRGTQVTSGRGRGLVIATGMNTEIGQIARLLQAPEADTPLQVRMRDFGKKLSYGVLAICAILFLAGLLRGEGAAGMLLLAISLAVAAIPEALPALITIALSRGASVLARQQALIRKLTAVETLGSVTYICTDKTGTLTLNRMTVTVTEPEGTTQLDGLPLLHAAMALNHSVQFGQEDLTGDPTETALVRYVLENAGSDAVRQLAESHPIVQERPFDSERKLMTTVHRSGEHYLVLVKGAVESVAERLAAEGAGGWAERAAAWGADGKRVLAYAYKFIDCLPANPEDWESGLHPAGLVALHDPPRPGIDRSIRACREAGIHPVMITGDHPETAAAIARQIGLLDGQSRVVSGREMEHWDAARFEAEAPHIAVYARVSPAQKLQIVEALQRRNQYVAMTGDGVNDAPSLRKANIGIAMGITGTDVSKEAAHMILLDDNFSTIVGAIREGRRVYDNIRRFVKYIMTCNTAEIWTIFLAPLLGLPLPLLPVHLLWINLITDGLPGLALSAESAEHNVMTRPPRPPGESLFAHGTGLHILWVGLLMAGLALGTQAIALHHALPHWQTLVFTTLSFAQLGHVWAIRSEDEFIFRKGFFSNHPLTATLVLTVALQLCAVYLPVANKLLHTQPLTLPELSATVAVAALLFHAVELEKWMRRLRRTALRKR
ncbi:MAG: cation-translocating P-type ATPase [Chitinophagaceae bacterium]|nr:MAG: cation-translocating P-type ATPase [Chitinophagaceae bacterium]